MLVPASRTSLRARAMLASRCLAPTSSAQALLVSRHRQHSRAFRLGPWSSQADPDAQRDARRRHRIVRYRYLESLNRRLSWDDHPRGDGLGKAAVRSAMAHFMHASNPRSCARYTDVDGVKSWSDDLSGVRPGRNIEDVERDAIDHLFRTGKATAHEYDLWTSPLQNIRNYLHSQLPHANAPPKQGSETTVTADEPDTVIDPITNRKVPKEHRNQPTSFASAKEDLDGRGPVVDGKATEAAVDHEAARDAAKYGTARWNEPDGLRSPSAEEESKKYKDLHKYASADTSGAPTPRQASTGGEQRPYSDLDKYKPVTWNEPDGLPSKSTEEASKKYDDLHKYGPVGWNEPHGRPEATPEEKSNKYEDLHKYGPVAWNEPHGQPRRVPGKESLGYNDLKTYYSPFVAKKSVLDAHDAKQQDPTPRGVPLPPKVEVGGDRSGRLYKDLDKYGPVRWNEPSGRRVPTPKELSEKYEDLHLYHAVKVNGPDGRWTLTPDETSNELGEDHAMPGEYEDLPKYIDFENGDPEVPLDNPEDFSKQNSDLHRYETFDNGDAISSIHPEESTANQDLSKYPSAGYEEPEGIEDVHTEELTKSYEDLDKYEPQSLDSNTTSLDGDPIGASIARVDAVAEALKPYDKQLESKRLATSFATHRGARDGFVSSSDEVDAEAMDSLTAQDIRARVLRRAKNNSHKHKLEEAKTQLESSWDASSEAALQKLKEKGQKGTRRLTGNYAQDFPEDFARSWSTAHAPSKSALYPKDQADASAAEEMRARSTLTTEEELGSMDESFPDEKSRLEPALNRHATRRPRRNAMAHHERLQAEHDPYSKEAQGLETCYDEECGGAPGRPTMVRHHAAKDKAAEDAISENEIGEPMVYKILAYDPTMQTIDVAETTSRVHDTSTPATPADVLLRLSNASKFFPHFRSLQNEGYEIVSGGGDVLVFRKMQATSPGKADKVSPSSAAARPWVPPVNPVDLMGKPPVTGNFASPTGFVNYDTLTGEAAEKPAPPFRSNLDVRREEPVFSGAKEDAGRTKRRGGLGKKVLVGTAWVAGGAYAVGVMGEYFRSGGADGKGPKGL